MKQKKYMVYIIMVVPLLLAIIAWSLVYGNQLKVSGGLPQLPRPIGQERVLITTAGQAVDGLLVSQIATSLNLRHDYRREITGPELPGRFATCVIVVGVSNKGLMSVGRTYGEEYKRVEGVVTGALDHQMPIVTLHIGGQERRNRSNDELLELLIPNSHYFIVMGNGNQDGYLAQLAQGAGIPFSEVTDFHELRIAFNSIFR